MAGASNSLLFSIPLSFYALAAIVFFVAYFFISSKKAKLDHIPGPWLAKYTNAWRGYQAWRIDHHKAAPVNYQIEMIGKYGDVVRIGPNHVLVYDPAAIDAVLGFKERLNKGPGYQVFRMTGTNQTALVSIKDEKTHGIYRRPIANAYSLSSLKGYEQYIDDTIEKLMAVIDRHVEEHKPINMTKWLQFWGFDVMSKISFGEPLGFLDQGYDFNGMIQAQRENFRYISIANNFPLLDTLTKRNPLLRLMRTKPSMFFSFSKRVVSERLAKAEGVDTESQKEKPSRQPDLLGSFIEARKDYPLMTEQRLTHLSATNVLAGANNSAKAMDVTMNWLARNLKEQDRLHDEIKAVKMVALGDKENDGPAALELAFKMPYLDAMIQESYRTFGAPANNLERIVGESGMCLPNGVQLPQGTIVAINASSMSALPHVYGNDVAEFNPSRWVKREGESGERLALMRKCLIAFGYGSRSCIGKNIVQLELYKLWATLLRLYKFEPFSVQLHAVEVVPRRRSDVEV